MMELPFLLNCWYVAAWSHEVADGACLGRQLLDRPVVLWRTEDGTCTAMEDACPHRFAALSVGRVEGQMLRCMYHGLLFDSDGRCIRIPGQGGGERALNVLRFPLVERDRMLWIWMGDETLADPALIPDCHWLSDPEWTVVSGLMHYDANFQLIADNLLDFSHLSYVHEKTLGGTDSAATNSPKVERFDWGVRVTHWHLNEQVPPAYKDLVDFFGLCDRWLVYDWNVRGNVLSMEVGFAPAGTGAPDGAQPPGTIVNHPIQAVTPETMTSAHYFWATPRNFALVDEGVSKRLRNQIEAAFLEDKLMIERQARNIRIIGNRTPGAIRADMALGHVRQLATRLLAAEGL